MGEQAPAQCDPDVSHARSRPSAEEQVSPSRSSGGGHRATRQELLVSISRRQDPPPGHDLLDEPGAIQAERGPASPEVRHASEALNQLVETSRGSPAPTKVPCLGPALRAVGQDHPEAPAGARGTRHPAVPEDGPEIVPSPRGGSKLQIVALDPPDRRAFPLPKPVPRQRPQPPGSCPSPISIGPALDTPPLSPRAEGEHPDRLAEKQLTPHLTAMVRAAPQVERGDADDGVGPHSPMGLRSTNRPNPSRSPNTKRRYGLW